MRARALGPRAPYQPALTPLPGSLGPHPPPPRSPAALGSVFVSQTFGLFGRVPTFPGNWQLLGSLLIPPTWLFPSPGPQATSDLPLPWAAAARQVPERASPLLSPFLSGAQRLGKARLRDPAPAGCRPGSGRAGSPEEPPQPAWSSLASLHLGVA